MQVQSGAFSSEQAIQTAVKDLSRQGVSSITYPSGHTDSLDVAVRRAIITGVNQTAAKLSEKLADELGCDLVEVTAHHGARPTHAEWQGQVYSRSGKTPGYDNFIDATGYGTGEGLCGWNCRHSFYPYYEGTSRAYSQKMLDEYNNKTVTYNGQKLTEYEATQQQRYIERQLRRWKREYQAMSAAGQPAGKAAAKIAEWNQRQADFLKQTGLKKQVGRTQVEGYNKSVSAKATWAARKNSAEDAKFLSAITGARITNIYGKAARTHAEKYYGLIRSMTNDVASIARNTGFSKKEVEAIKRFIFIDEHDLGGQEAERFCPDFAMAQSWQRLIEGNYVEHDITLLKHEIMEKRLMAGGMSQYDAHIAASAKFNYDKEVNDLYAALKKRKNKQ